MGLEQLARRLDSVETTVNALAARQIAHGIFLQAVISASPNLPDLLLRVESVVARSAQYASGNLDNVREALAQVRREVQAYRDALAAQPPATH